LAVVAHGSVVVHSRYGGHIRRFAHRSGVKLKPGLHVPKASEAQPITLFFFANEQVEVALWEIDHNNRPESVTKLHAAQKNLLKILVSIFDDAAMPRSEKKHRLVQLCCFETLGGSD
jgi:hypothetical protein